MTRFFIALCAALLAAETAKWEKLIREIGIRAD
jgi:hypothetical protein